MNKLVVFRFNGDFERGFHVTLEISSDDDRHGSLMERQGELPSNPEIREQYKTFQSAYNTLDLHYRNRISAPPAQMSNFRLIDECNTAAQDLCKMLNDWLENESFLPIRDKVIKEITKTDKVRVLLKTEDLYLQRLPWHRCDLFNPCSNAEIAISSLNCDPAPPSDFSYPVRILAVLGSSNGIDVEADRELPLRCPGAKVTFLKEPQRQELDKHLWQSSWSILFFTGHSGSQEDNEPSLIHINDTETLTIDDLKNALTDAIKNGLKIAILNSCDGLGLARELADLNIPQVIVMREPVPDKVAQEFFKSFLTNFSSGESFYLAVHRARENLQRLEDKFPCATWLPIIWQNPAEMPPNWPSPPEQPDNSQVTEEPLPVEPDNSQVTEEPPPEPLTSFLKSPLVKGLGIVVSGIIAASLAAVVISRLDEQKPLSTGKKILLEPADANSNKKAGVQAFARGNYTTAVAEFQASLQRNRNDPEALIYLNNARARNSTTLKIAVSVPIGNTQDVAKEILRGVAMAQDEVNRSGGINGQLLMVEIANDNNDPSIAKTLADEFVKDSTVLAVVGHNSSKSSIAAAPIYQRGKLVMISPTSTANNLSGIGNYIFRTVSSSSFDADALADYAINTAHRKNIAVCADSEDDASRSLSSEFKSAIVKAKGKVAPTTCDFSARGLNPITAVSAVLNDRADGLLLAPTVKEINQAVDVAKAATAAKQGVTLLSYSVMSTYSTRNRGKESVNGMVLTVPWHPTAVPGNPFPKNATKLWGVDATWRTATSYDATQAIIVGLKQGNSREGLQKALSNPGFSVTGATGKIKFLPEGDRAGTTMLVKIQPCKQQCATGYEFVPVGRQ